MKKVFLLVRLGIASGLIAPRILFAESGLVFDQTKGTLTGQFDVTSNIAAAGSVTAASATLTNAAGAGLTVSSSAYLAVSGGNVGIGTAGPEAPLHIRHLAAALSSYDDVLKINSFITGGAAGGADPGFGPAILFYGSIYGLGERNLGRIATVSEGGNVAGMSFYTQTTADSVTEKVRITSQGNVGIGTTGPGAKLEVNGSIKTTSGDIIVGPNRFIGDWQSAAGLYFDGNGRITATTQNSLPFVITGGNVGIGTTSPGYKLDVNGSLNVGGNYTGTTGSYSSYLTMASLVVADPGAAYYAFGSRIGGTLGIVGGVSIGSAGAAAPANGLLVGGNVGIGTTSFGTSKLNVNGNIGMAGTSGTSYLYFPDTGSHTGTLQLQAGYGSTSAGGGLTLYGASHATNPGSVAIGLSNNTSAKFRVNTSGTDGGTDLFTVLETGNVGIGTTAPGEKLDVAGIIRSTTGGFKFPDNTTQTTAAPGDWIRLTTNLTTYGNSATQCQSEFGAKWSVCGYPEVAGFVKDITQLGLSGVIAWIACGRSSMLQSGAIKKIGISGDAADSGVWTCPADKGCNWEQFAGSGGYLHCYRTESTQQKVYCCRNQL